MGTPRQRKFVNRTDIASTAITLTQPSLNVIDNQYPTGDMICNSINLNLQGTLSLITSGAGTIVTRGGLQFMRSYRLESDKHGVIINGLDGIMLHQLLAIRNGVRGINVDISSAGTGAPTYAYNLRLLFADRNAVRPEDSALDLFASRLRQSVQYGIVTDFISAGTYSVESVDAFRQEVGVDLLPGPIDISADGPIMQPFWDVRRDPITATASQYQILLPYGDRLVKRYVITQRNGSTLAEIANTVIGNANTDRLSLKVNGFPWLDNTTWDSLQTQNAEEFGLTMPTGVGVVDFFPKRAGGPKLSDALNMVSNQNGMDELYVDVTTQTNGQIWTCTDALKPLAPAAQRPAPTTQGR